MLAPITHLGYLQRFRKKYPHLSLLLPWFALLPSPTDDRTDGLILTKDEGLMRTYRVKPLDLARLSAHERAALLGRLNGGWRLLQGAQWAVWHDAAQVPVRGYPRRRVEAPMVAQILDEDQGRRLNAPGASWTTEIHLTVWHRPLARTTSLMDKMLYTKDEDDAAQVWDEARAIYDTAATQFIDVLAGACETIEPLDNDGVLTYLHSLVSDKRHPVYEPEIRTHLDYVLADSPLRGGIMPKLGEDSLGCVSIRSFPKRTRTNLLLALHGLGIPLRFSVRWVPKTVEEATSQLTSREDNFRSMMYSWKGMIYSMFSSHGSDAEGDIHTGNAAHESNFLRDELASERLSLGDTTLSIIVRARDRKTLRRSLREVERVCHVHGCLTVRERLGAVSTWLGSLAGNPAINPRHYEISSWNVLHLTAWSHGWAGQERTHELDAPPLAVAMTNGVHRHNIVLHVQDLANAFFLGPPGSGKSALVWWLVVMWMARYDRAQLFGFDLKRAGRVPALCLGFRYFDISPYRDVCFQPFRLIHLRDEFNWAVGWVLDRLKEDGITPLTVPWDLVEMMARTAMEALGRRALHERTLTNYVDVLYEGGRHVQAHHGRTPEAILQAGLALRSRVQGALVKFTRGHEAGYLLDGDHDDLDEGMPVFEREQLLATPALIPAFETYAWHRLMPRLQGQPTLAVMEEWAISMEHPASFYYVNQGLRLKRDKRLSFALVSQDVKDVTREATEILEISCPTRFYLPNSAANDYKPRQAYEALGVRPQGILDIAGARPKGQVLIQQRPYGEALVDVTLSDLQRVVCGRSSVEDHALVDKFLTLYGAEEFAPAWFTYWGFEDEAKRIADWQKEQRRSRGDPVLMAEVSKVLAGDGGTRGRGESMTGVHGQRSTRMRRRWMLLLAPVALTGCINSRALGQLLMPRVVFAHPGVWDCSARVPHLQGQTRMDGTPELCQRCVNRSETIQAAAFADIPYLVPAGAALYRCETGQGFVDPSVVVNAAVAH